MSEDQDYDADTVSSNAERSRPQNRSKINRREILKSVGVAGAAVMAGPALFSSSAAASDHEFLNPVFEPVLADPEIIRTNGGTWYVYGTEDSWGDGNGFRTLPIIKSDDLVNWTYVGEVFGRRDTLDENPSSGDPTWDWNGNGVWAPEIAYHDGRYLLYYSLFDRDAESHIGVATSNSPEGPWTDHGEVVSSWNSIDPEFFKDSDGTPYLAWGSYGDEIYIAELTADGLSVTGSWTQVCRRGFEGPVIIKRNGYYYLFLSAGQCCTGHSSDYHVHVARSTSLTGPYTDPAGRDFNTDGSNIILDGSNRFIAPGHNTITVDDTGNDWMVYHAYDSTKPENAGSGGGSRRSLMVDRIIWNNDWPTIGGGSPHLSAPAPAVNVSTGPLTDGVYQIENVNSGKLLEVGGWGTDDGDNVIQWPSFSAANQQWALTSLGGETYAIQNVNSGKYLSVEGTQTNNGATIWQWSWTGKGGQEWTITDLGGNEYRLSPAHTDRVMEVYNGSTNDGANVQQYDWNNGAWQKWTFTPV